MKRLAVLAVLALGPCVTLAAPVPKVPLPETESQKNTKLRAYYDQLQRDLGDTAEGQKLSAEVGRTRAIAKSLVTVERQLSKAVDLTDGLALGEAQRLHSFCKMARELRRSPREEELFLLSLWEVQHDVQPRP